MSSFCFLKDRLPRAVILASGRKLEIDTRTCRAIACIERIPDASLSNVDKVYYVLGRLFGEQIIDLSLDEMGDAYGKAIDFLAREGVCSGRQAGKNKPDFDFIQDSGLIVAAFIQAYHLSYDDILALHWWLFIEMLNALPGETTFVHIRQIRTMDLPAKGDMKQIAKLRQMKRSVALIDRRTDAQKKKDLQDQIDSLDL